MDYTLSNAYATDAATGNRMHQGSAAIPTAVTDQDMNGLTWEMVSAIKAAGMLPVAFDKTNPQSFTQLAQAIQSGRMNASAAAGTADAITATFNPPVTMLIDGMQFFVRAAAANATTAPTFTPAPGVIPAAAIVKGAGTALQLGDIAGVGHWLELQYDAVTNKWILQNPVSGILPFPTGMPFYFAGDTPPPGALERTGAAISRTAYARLFAVIGTRFGAGDGINTFNLPEGRGEFDRGWDHGRGVDPGRALGSYQFGTVTIAQKAGDRTNDRLLGLDVPGSATTAQALAAIGADPLSGSYGSANGTVSDGTIPAATESISGSMAYAYCGTTRPRNVSYLACIKY